MPCASGRVGSSSSGLSIPPRSHPWSATGAVGAIGSVKSFGRTAGVRCEPRAMDRTCRDRNCSAAGNGALCSSDRAVIQDSGAVVVSRQIDIYAVMVSDIAKHCEPPFKRHWTMDADYLQLCRHERVLATRYARMRRLGLSSVRKQPAPGRPRTTAVSWRSTKADRVAAAAADVAAKRAAARAYFGITV